MASIYQEGRAAERNADMERPLVTREPQYKQTNMPRVLITIFALALLATFFASMFFFNLTDFI